MIFSSYKFIFVFLPVVFIGYVLLNRLKVNLAAKLWLVLVSFYFYAQGSFSFMPFFAGTVFFNYIIGYLIIKNETGPHALLNKKILLAIGLAENILLLGYFKYINFFIKNINLLAGTDIALKKIILPIGISFFTFQLIAYLIDCYRGETKQYSAIDYLLFITFFPQLIVGPIVHHKDIVPQFENEENRKINWDNIQLGVIIFIIGCGKKVLLADPLTSYAQNFFVNTPYYGALVAWLSSLAYTISYYFDLSGYADMAIGLGLLFNIHIPQNFNSPYKARNFADYWRRWHMTLSKFLSDYVFRSLYKKGKGSVNFYFAVMMTFLVSGFWHGSAWSFIAWGLINGLFVCMAHFMTRRKWQLPFLPAWGLTFLGVVGTRILFVSNGFTGAIQVYNKLFDFSEFSGLNFNQAAAVLKNFALGNVVTILYLVIGMYIAFFGKTTSRLVAPLRMTGKFDIRYAMAAGLLLAITVFQMSQVSEFLYFQF